MTIHFKDPVYEISFFVVIGKENWKFEEIKKSIISNMKMVIKDRKNEILWNSMKPIFDRDVEGYCFQNLDVVLILLKECDNSAGWHSTLSHEIFHATDFVLGAAGLPLIQGTQEAYAYYNGFIHKQILNQLWKAPKKLK